MLVMTSKVVLSLEKWVPSSLSQLMEGEGKPSAEQLRVTVSPSTTSVKLRGEVRKRGDTGGVGVGG